MSTEQKAEKEQKYCPRCEEEVETIVEGQYNRCTQCLAVIELMIEDGR